MKKALILSFLLMISFSLFAQEQTENSEQVAVQDEGTKISKKRPFDMTFSFAPSLMLNLDSEKKSAPSPVIFPVTFGFVYPQNSKISFQPQLSFYIHYMLWAEDKALPAEIENRTASVFAFLLDLPAVYNFKIKEIHNLEAGAGVSVNIRFASLSQGVNGSDSGSSGTAESDVSKINDYLWKDCNFLLLNFRIAYMYQFGNFCKAGPEFRFYLPVGSLISQGNLQDAIFSLGIKIRF